MTTRDDWREKLASAVAPRIGTRDQRAAFADGVLASLGGLLPRGARAQTRANDLEKITKASREARDSFARLRVLVDDGILDARRLHFESDWVAQKKRAASSDESWCTDLDAINAYLQHYATRAVALERSAPRRKPGRNNLMAIIVAEGIAKQYQLAFGSRPAVAKRAATGTRSRSPFDRACDVVGEMMASFEYSLRLSESARRQGISRLAQRAR